MSTSRLTTNERPLTRRVTKALFFRNNIAVPGRWYDCRLPSRSDATVAAMRLAAVMIPLVVLSLSCGGGTAAPDPVQLVDVVDGDSIRLLIDGSVEHVRLVGLNTPEADECHATEARIALRSLTTRGALRVEQAGADDRDRFGRLLRYVYSEDTLINLAMLAGGHGLAVQGDHPRNDDFIVSTNQAWTDRRGMWSPRACGAAPTAGVVIAAIEPNPPGDDAERSNDEYVTIRNDGETAVDLSEWRVRDESSSNRFTFAAGSVLSAGAQVTVHSGCGIDSARDVHWCAGPVWSNGGDTAILLAPNGNVADRFSYGPD